MAITLNLATKLLFVQKLLGMLYKSYTQNKFRNSWTVSVIYVRMRGDCRVKYAPGEALMASGSSGRHLASGSGDPGFESWLFQVAIETLRKAIYMHFPHIIHV